MLAFPVAVGNDDIRKTLDVGGEFGDQIWHAAFSWRRDLSGDDHYLRRTWMIHLREHWQTGFQRIVLGRFRPWTRSELTWWRASTSLLSGGLALVVAVAGVGLVASSPL
jgi:hypothetical protein